MAVERLVSIVLGLMAMSNETFVLSVWFGLEMDH